MPFEKIRTTAAVALCHIGAVASYAAAPRPAGISELWPLQFALMAVFSSIFLAAAVWIPRTSVRPVLLSVVAGLHLMSELPLGTADAPAYFLAAAFLCAVFAAPASRGRLLAAGAYILLCAFGRGAVSAWDIDMPSPTALDRALYLCFSAAAAGLLEALRSGAVRAEALERRAAGLVKNIDALSSANIDFQEYATRVQREAQQAERNRIAREIHDIMGYTLMNLQMMMEAALDMHEKGSDALHDLLAKARDHTQRGLLETRNAMRSLRTLTEPDSSGLRGLNELTRIFENATGVKVEFNPGNFPERLEPELEDTLRRLLQESLTNSFRHGNAETVVVNFWRTGEELRIAIHDDGAGTAQVVPGIGIAGMRERLAALGGALEIRDGGTGFGLTATIPYPIKERNDERNNQRAVG